MQSPDRSGFTDLVQPQQLKRLGHMIHAIDPALVIVDSLPAATSRGETSLQAARVVLGGLAALARMGQFAMLVIHHLRKRPRPGWATLDLGNSPNDPTKRWTLAPEPSPPRAEE